MATLSKFFNHNLFFENQSSIRPYNFYFELKLISIFFSVYLRSLTRLQLSVGHVLIRELKQKNYLFDEKVL